MNGEAHKQTRSQQPFADEGDNEHAWLEEGFLSTVDACALLRGTIPLEIRRWCIAGFIRYVKEPASGRYLVSETDIRGLAKYCDGRSLTTAQVKSWYQQTSSAEQ